MEREADTRHLDLDRVAAGGDRHRVIGWLTPVAVFVVGALAVLAIQPGTAALFHDEGIYLSVAKGLAEGDGYRLGSLPGSPLQTKYPFLYSGILAAVWKVFPTYPENIGYLKGVGAVSLIAVALLAARWYAVRGNSRDVWQAVFVLLLCINPSVLRFVDIAVTDLPFMALTLGVLVLAERVWPRERSVSVSVRDTLLLGALSGAALLLRQAALPIVVAAVLLFASRRQWKQLALFTGMVAVWSLPWVAFKVGAPPTTADPLISYYTGYEPSALELVATLGLREACAIVWWNAAYVAETIDRTLFLSAMPVLRFVIYPLVAVGLWKVFTTRSTFVPLFATAYLALIVLWPFHPWRYTLPFLPAVVLGLVVGSRQAVEALARRGRSTGSSRVERALAAIPLALVVLVAVWWGASVVAPEENIDRWTGEPALFSWAGFEETSDWIGANTPRDAVLATAYDGLFYLNTGRRGVRPWIHRPWTYYYPPGDNSNAQIGPASEVQRSLESLGVTHVVVSPLHGHAEGEAGDHLFADLLQTYTAPGFEAQPELLFESRDGRHRVYRLPARTRGPTSGVP